MKKDREKQIQKDAALIKGSFEFMNPEMWADFPIPPDKQAGDPFVINHKGQKYRVEAPDPIPPNRIMTIRLRGNA